MLDACAKRGYTIANFMTDLLTGGPVWLCENRIE